MRRNLLIAALCTLIAQPVFAEFMVLKTGRVFEGKLVGKTDEYVTLDVNGANHTYKTEEISYFGPMRPPSLAFSRPSTSSIIPSQPQSIIQPAPTAGSTEESPASTSDSAAVDTSVPEETQETTTVAAEPVAVEVIEEEIPVTESSPEETDVAEDTSTE